STDQKTRRKEQNRAAQRAFRERKERYVKELETKIKDMEIEHTKALASKEKEIETLLYRVTELENELNKIKGYNKPLSSAVACIRDKDGHSFCERLKEEVCSSAFNQLLSEPLFDASGTFNEKVTDHPVPIVTERIKENNNRLNESLANDDNFDFSSPHPDTLLPNNELITCAIAWKSLSTHPKFEVIDVDMLCTELKKIAKCSNTGPVFSQHDLNIVLKWMDTIS
ncbi:hypothetical protein BJ944DRAFT_158734, partial [Cunninghamella echinulata]